MSHRWRALTAPAAVRTMWGQRDSDGGSIMAKPMIRHIAVCTEDVRELADFYKATFGLEEVGGVVPDDGKFAVFLSDGYINLAILLARGGKQGINHFGFQVDDIE